MLRHGTLSRYFGGHGPEPLQAPPENPGPAAATGGRDTLAAAVQDFLFQPARLEIAAGTTVVWTTKGQVPLIHSRGA